MRNCWERDLELCHFSLAAFITDSCRSEIDYLPEIDHTSFCVAKGRGAGPDHGNGPSDSNPQPAVASAAGGRSWTAAAAW